MSMIWTISMCIYIISFGVIGINNLSIFKITEVDKFELLSEKKKKTKNYFNKISTI